MSIRGLLEKVTVDENQDKINLVEELEMRELKNQNVKMNNLPFLFLIVLFALILVIFAIFTNNW
jgi:hypothetical protein